MDDYTPPNGKNKESEEQKRDRLKQLLKAEISRLRNAISLTLNAYHSHRIVEKDPRIMSEEHYIILDNLGFCYDATCHDLLAIVGPVIYLDLYNYPELIEEAYDICVRGGVWGDYPKD